MIQPQKLLWSFPKALKVIFKLSKQISKIEVPNLSKISSTITLVSLRKKTNTQ